MRLLSWAVAIGPVRFTRVGDEWVGYRVVGERRDRALLFLPTLASNIDVLVEPGPLRTFFEEVAEFATVVLFDRRGTGVSDGMPSRIAPTLEDWADDALAVLAATELEHVGLLAHGMGVPPALLFAAAHPARVDALVLLQGFARLTSAPGYEIGVPATGNLVDRLVDSVSRSWGEGSAYFIVNDVPADDSTSVDQMARHERATFGRAAAARAYRTWLSVDVRDVVTSVQAPALILVGTGSRSPVGASRWLASELPEATLIEHASRNFDWWHLDGRDVAVAAIEEFVTGARAARAAERVLATVLFTDIVNSTRTAAEMGDRRWRSVLEHHDALAARVVAAHRGRLVKQAGDGILATFDGPGRAVACAQELQVSMAAAGIVIRAGLHTGEIELRGDDVAGVAVHLASRVAAHAGAGETLVSRTVPDLVAGSGMVFESRGCHELKGIEGEWELYAVADGSGHAG